MTVRQGSGTRSSCLEATGFLAESQPLKTPAAQTHVPQPAPNRMGEKCVKQGGTAACQHIQHPNSPLQGL